MNQITATAVPVVKRMNFLPMLFTPQLMMHAEALLYTYADKLANESYKGGLWEFYNLSNGGGYAAPLAPAQMNLNVDGNGFEGDMSADAAGIVFTLFVLGQLAHEHAGTSEVLTDKFSDHYHQLRDYASEHAEAGSIFRAID
jgi:hypothetical protein